MKKTIVIFAVLLFSAFIYSHGTTNAEIQHPDPTGTILVAEIQHPDPNRILN